MDLGDVTAGERDNRCLASVRGVRVDHDGGACSFCLGQRVGEIGNLGAGYFAPVRIRKMPVGDQHGCLAEVGFDPDAAIGWMITNGYPTAAVWYPPPENAVLGLRYVYIASRGKVFTNGTWDIVLRAE